MTVWVRDATAFKKVKKIWVHDGTSNRLVQKAWVHDGTSFKLAFVNFVPGLPAGPINNSTNDPTNAYVNFNTDGGIETSAGVISAWGDPLQAGVGSDYWIKFTNLSYSGNVAASDYAGAWLSLSSARGILAGPAYGYITCRAYISSDGTDGGIIGTYVNISALCNF